ncbi:alpha/beta hydrolase fold protein-like protein [Byssothecium circinans]|uniref:Alpha/beta hydrolase fold protein-like protein n=1 Tax=Byssothecium circinans TaxID=147558 RepID=A0A6A5TLN8_9PLEO|nr:alpha/beta hydrolase fold protein-like protein [Byssothecium circinans]
MADQNVSKVGIASATAKAMLTASARLWTSPFKGQKGAQNYFKDVMFSMMRVQLGNLDTAQERYWNGTSTPVYLKYAQDNGFEPQSVTLSSGVQAHWLGDKDAKKVILWFHGGYVLPVSPGHFAYLSSIKDTLAAQGSSVAVLFLAYDLAPESTYPTQLRQAVECLRYLIQTTGRAPRDITLGGDSAGGNLTMGVLSHLAHPHPEIATLHLPTKLHAALLISPWCSFNTHTPAFESNAEKDFFDRRTLLRWSSAFLGSDSPFAGDYYNEPVLAPASWWEDTAHVIDEVLIWAGGSEILLDGVEEFAKRFTKGFGGKGGRVNTIVTPNAAHIEMIIELLLGYKGDSGTGSAEVVKNWARAKL